MGTLGSLFSREHFALQQIAGESKRKDGFSETPLPQN